MRLLVVFIAIALANVAAYGFLTRPTSNELKRLEARQRELDDILAVQEKTTTKWNQLAELVETAESVLNPLLSGEGSAQSSLRKAFLEAERGLGLQRETLELRPDRQPPKGFVGVRIRVIQMGYYADLVAYLRRISRLKVPLEPVEMSIVESSRGPAPLMLTLTWSAIWPEVPES
jgi:Tfp pilus assembly protein PilO